MHKGKPNYKELYVMLDVLYFTQPGEFYHTRATYSQKYPTPTFRENPTPNFWKARTYSSQSSFHASKYSVHTPATLRIIWSVCRSNVPTALSIFQTMIEGLPWSPIPLHPVVSFRIIRQRRLRFGDCYFPPCSRGCVNWCWRFTNVCTNPQRALRTFRDQRFPHTLVRNSEFRLISIVWYPIGTGWCLCLCRCGCWCWCHITFGTVSSV